MNTRPCTKCLTDKPFPEGFYRDARKLTGRRPICKDCDKVGQQKYKGKYRGRYTRVRDTAKESAYKRAYLAEKRATDPAYREYKAAHDRAYRQTPAGKLTRLRAKARRRAKAGNHTLKPEEWQRTVTAFNGKCAYCLRPVKLVPDHFIPVFHDGHTVVGNMVPACASCNSSKQHRMPDEWCSPEQYRRVMDTLLSL